jgi:uncharacterized membrane protein
MVGKNQPQKIFLLFSLIIGTILIIITPIGAGFDEDTHVARIWEMSNFKFTPNSLLEKGPYFPQIFYELSYRQKDIIRPIDMNFYLLNINRKIDWNNMINHQTRSIYFPTLYLVQAFIMGILGRFLNTPILIIYFFLRFSYLLTYTLLVYLAIKIIPFGKNLLAFLALSPMAMIQASIISPDAISNGISFFFFAWIIYLCAQKVRIITKKQLIITFVMVALLSTTKINSLVLILLLLIIPKRLFQSTKEYMKFWIITILIIVVICGGWNFITVLNPAEGISGQKLFTLENLSEVQKNGNLLVESFGNDLKNHSIQYLKEWIGVLGYGYWNLPSFVYVIYPILLISTVLSESGDEIFSFQKRSFMFFLFILGFCFVFFIFQSLLAEKNSFDVSGVQGRYFIPISPLLFFAFVRNKAFLKIKESLKSKCFMGIFCILSICVVIPAYFDYHINCGNSYLQGGLCYLPKYKNWSPNSNISEPLKYEQVYEQTFLFECDPVNEIRVWVYVDEIPENESVEVQLYDSTLKTEILKKDIEKNELKKSGWLSIPVTEFYPEKDTIYILSIKTTNYYSNVRLGLSSRDDYKEGSLKINGISSYNDLLFDYGCLITR